jgi:flagellar hook protein FlgE
MGFLTSLFTGVSGLGANGQALSVIGDNIANTNTSGFKGSRAVFSDVLSQALGGGSSFQIGRGANLQTIQQIFTQGTLENTSNPLDMAIEGDGFFIIKETSGAQYYTRAGQFTLDKDGNIVNPEGLQLQGKILTGSQSGQVSTINVSSLNSPPNKTTSSTINANLNSSTTAKDPTPDTFVVTSSNNTIVFTDSGGTQTQTIATGSYTGAQLAAALKTALEAPATADTYTVNYNSTTHKFDITSNNAAFDLQTERSSAMTAQRLLGFITEGRALSGTTTLYSDYTIVGDGGTSVFTIDSNNNTLVFTDSGGTDQTLTLTSGSYTANNLADELEDKIVAEGAASDAVRVYYDQDAKKFYIKNGEAASVTMKFSNSSTTLEQIFGYQSVDETIAAAGTSVPDYVAVGFDPLDAADTSDFSTSMTVYDSLGNSHLVSVYFKKTRENETLTNDTTKTGNTWHWYAVAQSSDSVTTQISVGAQGYLEFDTAGRLVADIQQFNDFDFSGGVDQSQTIAFDFGTSTVQGGSGLTGSTQFGSANSVIFQTQNGYASGSLVSLAVGQDGTMTGTFTNGQTQNIAQVYLARFIAPTKLTKIGRNLYSESSSSGSAIIGAPNTSGRGRVMANSVESSNVDLADEFVRMISAQRGFQANTRVITTTDDLLNELMSIKR